ncbi:MAG: hypothetical protein A3G34_09795 [Candidatus Lindowbacteria bacterium RIFCSPLOWO2_12_FULL_62_27]|nr:MAG: hypothetical protein A3G34_09795 [Candidatus Lindowbacteria bacterium RIFCSPLOWO2_12_FULL_62_27]OGH61536.1 MAG: hypothetical protein A3I06_02795 [Candidatus Lindowbacteria bacterium RIFCSPLOWO2_02_FULL_62_12]
MVHIILGAALAVLLAGGVSVSSKTTRTRKVENRKAAAEARVAVRFEVRFPAVSSPDTIYLSGNLKEAGAWRPDGMALDRNGHDLAVGVARLPAGSVLEYKITRGSWSTVEKDSAYEDIPNRLFVVPAASEHGRDGVVVRADVAAWADAAPRPASTLTGDIRFHERFGSRHLGNERTIAVYLPPGYETSKARYPVLYVHDGQNAFDAHSSVIGVEWGIDERCQELIESGEIPPVIVVAVWNSDDRMSEYTTAVDTGHGQGGRGRLYEKFLIEEVKPYIDRVYRTKRGREHTAVMGSSLGGLLSLRLAWERSDVFSRAGVVSPALWWADGEIFRRIERSQRPPKISRLWIDMGTAEGGHPEFNVDTLRRLGSLLEKKGYARGRDFMEFVAEGADHSERAWSARVGDILKYLFN